MPTYETTVTVPIRVHFNYRKREEQTNDSPETSESIDISSVIIGDASKETFVYLDDYLYNYQEDELTEDILENKDNWED